jgi:hypothetical protein
LFTSWSLFELNSVKSSPETNGWQVPIFSKGRLFLVSLFSIVELFHLRLLTPLTSYWRVHWRAFFHFFFVQNVGRAETSS